MVVPGERPAGNVDVGCRAPGAERVRVGPPVTCTLPPMEAAAAGTHTRLMRSTRSPRLGGPREDDAPPIARLLFVADAAVLGAQACSGGEPVTLGALRARSPGVCPAEAQ
jgi:hypothetical protein